MLQKVFLGGYEINPKIEILILKFYSLSYRLQILCTKNLLRILRSSRVFLYEF